MFILFFLTTVFCNQIILDLSPPPPFFFEKGFCQQIGHVSKCRRVLWGDLYHTRSHLSLSSQIRGHIWGKQGSWPPPAFPEVEGSKAGQSQPREWWQSDPLRARVVGHQICGHSLILVSGKQVGGGMQDSRAQGNGPWLATIETVYPNPTQLKWRPAVPTALISEGGTFTRVGRGWGGTAQSPNPHPHLNHS